MSTINGTNAADSLVGTGGADIIRGLGGDDTIRGGAGADSMLGGAGNDLIIGIGDGWGDTLRGEAGDDTLLGGGDSDDMYGGDGSDVIAVGASDYGNGEAGDDILVAAPSIEAATGTSLAVGGDGVDAFDLRLYDHGAVVWMDRTQVFWDGFYTYGVEAVFLNDYDSTVWGGAGQDLIIGGAGDDQIDGGKKGDLLAGADGDDRVSGGEGNDIIAASPGSDNVNGGDGIDQIQYFDATSGVTVDLEGSAWTEQFGYENLTSIEQLAGSGFDDRLYAGSGDDTILGMAGDDVILASSGIDLLDGGEGIDTVFFSSADLQGFSAVFDLAAHTATLTGGSATTYVNFEIVDGTGGDDIAIASDGDDVFNGGSGFDTITYAAATGAITLSLSVLDAQDTGASGMDELNTVDEVIGSAFGDWLQAGFYSEERLRGEGGADTLVGTGGTDSLWGGDGDDLISGLTITGNYFIDGGAGFDTVSFAAAREGLSIKLDAASAQTIGKATYRMGAIEKVIGTKYDDVFSGATGQQAVDGGKGDDLLTYATAKRGVVLDLSMGGVVGIERIEGSGFRDAVTGDNAGNTIGGLGGADVLIGLGGADVLEGGVGDDLVLGGKGDDQLAGGDGLDTVSFGDAGFAVSANLSVGRAQIGAAEIDTFSGFENLIGSKLGDTVFGGDAVNVLAGGKGNDTLSGQGGDDVVSGGAGDDIVSGGAGADRLSGGKGNDQFAFRAAGDSAGGAADTITDLKRGDIIDLSSIDADITRAGKQAFDRVAAFDGHAGELVLSYDAASDITHLMGDIDGDGAADLDILLDGDQHAFRGLVL